MSRRVATKPASGLPRGVAILAVLVGSLLAAALGACGTLLEVEPDGASADGGTDGTGGNDGTTTLDGSEIELDSSIACPVSADRVQILMGEVLAGLSHTEKVHLTTVSPDAKTVSVVVTGAGFSGSKDPLVVEPGTGATFDVTFDAGDAGAGVAAGQLAIRQGACLITLELGARRSNALFAVSPGQVDLGTVACGDTPMPATVSIQSASGVASNWEASLSTPTPFTLPAVDGGVQPMTVTTFSVGSGPLVPKAPPRRFDGVLTLSIGAEAPRDIPVTVLSVGAILAFSPSPVTLAKGQSQATFNVTNNGNQAVTLVFLPDGVFTFAPSKPFMLAAGATQAVTATAVINGEIHATVVPQASPPLCAQAGVLVLRPQ